MCLHPEICRPVVFLCPQAVGGGRFPLQGCMKSAYSVSLSALLDRLDLRLMLIKISGSVVMGFFIFISFNLKTGSAHQTAKIMVQ